MSDSQVPENHHSQIDGDTQYVTQGSLEVTIDVYNKTTEEIKKQGYCSLDGGSVPTKPADTIAFGKSWPGQGGTYRNSADLVHPLVAIVGYSTPNPAYTAVLFVKREKTEDGGVQNVVKTAFVETRTKPEMDNELAKFLRDSPWFGEKAILANKKSNGDLVELQLDGQIKGDAATFTLTVTYTRASTLKARKATEGSKA